MFNDIEAHFWTHIDTNLSKINDFYQRELSIATKHVNEIRNLVTSAQVISNVEAVPVIQENILETYKGLDMLMSYCQHNANEFRRLVKLWDGNNPHTKMGMMVLKNKLTQNAFVENEEIERQKQLLEAALGILLDLPTSEVKKKINNIYAPNKAVRNKTKHLWASGFSCCTAILVFACYCQLIMDGQFQKLSLMAQFLIRSQYQLAFIVICFGLLCRFCVLFRINYQYLLEFPTDIMISSASILNIGFVYWSLISLSATFAIAQKVGLIIQLPLPFALQLNIILQWVPSNIWLVSTTVLHLIVLYYSLIGIFCGKFSGIKQLMIIIYKTITPWAHSVSLANFFVGTLTTSVIRLIKDFSKIVSFGLINDYVLTLLTAYPSFIRVVQCYKKYLTLKKYYPHGLNGTINALAMVGCFLHSAEISANKNVLFYVLFCVRVVEIAGKIYWDFWEDAAMFYGGTGAAEFRKTSWKWQYLWFVRRPSFLPLWVFVAFTIYNTVSRLLWMDCLLQLSFVQSFWWMSIVALNEIFRRYYWALLRLDNQQATNCESYLATRYVPVPLDLEEVQIDLDINSAARNRGQSRKHTMSFAGAVALAKVQEDELL